MKTSNRWVRLLALGLAVGSLPACWWHRQRYEPVERGERREERREHHEHEHEEHEEHEQRR